MKTKLLNILAALALSFAALATPSASAYYAYVVGQTTDVYGLAVDVTVQSDAIGLAIADCIRRHGSDRTTDCNAATQRTGSNACIGIYVTNEGADAIDNQLFIHTTEHVVNGFCDDAVNGITVMGFPQFNVAPTHTSCVPQTITEPTCDHTCSIDRRENQPNKRGCDDVCPPETPIAMGRDCREANPDECVFLDDTPIYDMNVDGKCRAALNTCDADNSVPDGNDGCVPCGNNEEEMDDACVCVDMYEKINGEGECVAECVDNKDRNDADECVCAEDQEQVNGEGDCVDKCGDNQERLADRSCVDECGEDQERLSDNSCVAKCGEDQDRISDDSCVAKCELPETRDADDNCVDMTDMTDEETAPEFTFSVDDNDLQTTTEDARYEIPSEQDAAAIEINTATTAEGDFSYSKAGGSEALTVNGEGIVSFIQDTVEPGGYEIFIAVAQSESIITTLSLYLTVAETQPPPPPPSSQTPQAKSKDHSGKIASLAVLGIVLYHASTKLGKAQINWTPSYAVNHHNGNMQYSAGSRWTATADNWQYFWQTRQTQNQFAYGSGMRYNGNIFAAAMHSESQNNNTDVVLAFSANQTVGLWHIGGGVNFDMQLSETETDTQNRLNAQVRYTVDKWILSANANTDGNTAAARINYSYRF